VTKPYGKTSASVREGPLSAAALAALDDVPARLDTRLVFPSARGAHVNLRNFRRREWHPALEAAGVPSRRIYDLRSTFASQALAAGASVFELARILGTSVRRSSGTTGRCCRARAMRSAASWMPTRRGVNGSSGKPRTALTLQASSSERTLAQATSGLAADRIDDSIKLAQLATSGLGAALRQPPVSAAVGVHDVDPVLALAVADEEDLPPVRRPGGIGVERGVAR
jgi:hypothetical protein